MTDTKLGTELRSMIRQYGFEQVDQSLRAIGISSRRTGRADRSRIPSNTNVRTKPKRKRMARATAAEYVAKMELPPEKSPAVLELANRFHDKSFLPTFGEIRSFCRVYGIEVPTSKSRAAALPRVFKFIAAMETSEIQRLLDDEMFSGPSRLGPIADAIRRNGRAASRTRANRRDVG